MAPDPADFLSAGEHLQTRKAAQLSRELAMNVLNTNNVEEPLGLEFLLDELHIAKPRMRLTGSQRAQRKRPRALALYEEFDELRRWGRMYCDPAGPGER